ncbi:MAG: hypothetical protein Q4B78_03255 [Bacillota bacterium]|nr:hypothetical protein [Bacillota bacterium]
MIRFINLLCEQYIHIKITRRRSGFYSVEAAICLPIVILAILTIGYFIKVDSTWEQAMHEALNRCSYKAAVSSIGVHTYHVEDSLITKMPLGFGKEYTFSGRIKYRDFNGNKYDPRGMGTDGLEGHRDSTAVWIFPLCGEKYHRENCTYVKATVHREILSGSLKRKYEPCGLCHSESMTSGSIAFCFSGENTSYHYGTCRSIKRHTIVIDRTEAAERGYTSCSKCCP